MYKVKLLSWHPESAARATVLSRPDIKIDSTPLVRTSSVVSELAAANPAVLVLDLDKLPSNSREISLMLRASKSAQHIPILFAGSLHDDEGRLPEKYNRLRSELPDIVYTIWSNAPQALRSLLENPPTIPPVVPAPRTYTASLARKLGIVSATNDSARAKHKVRKVALLAAPDDFISLLGDLPATVAFTTRIDSATTLAICFIRTLNDLASTLDLIVFHLPTGVSAWIAFPKRAAHPHLEFNEDRVRDLALAAGLVDYKICSIDTTWSAMKFVRRKVNKS